MSHSLPRNVKRISCKWGICGVFGTFDSCEERRSRSCAPARSFCHSSNDTMVLHDLIRLPCWLFNGGLLALKPSWSSCTGKKQHPLVTVSGSCPWSWGSLRFIPIYNTSGRAYMLHTTVNAVRSPLQLSSAQQTGAAHHHWRSLENCAESAAAVPDVVPERPRNSRKQIKARADSGFDFEWLGSVRFANVCIAKVTGTQKSSMARDLKGLVLLAPLRPWIKFTRGWPLKTSFNL